MKLKAVTLATMILVSTGCVSYNRPVTEADFKISGESGEPYGLITMTVLDESSEANVFRSYVQIDLLDEKRQTTHLLADQTSLAGKTSKDGVVLTFKLKPGRYGMEDFAVRSDEQVVRGVRWEASKLSMPPKEAILFEVKEGETVNLGKFRYQISEKKEDFLYRLASKLTIEPEGDKTAAQSGNEDEA